MRLVWWIAVVAAFAGVIFAINDAIINRLWADHVDPVIDEMPKATRTRCLLGVLVVTNTLTGLFVLADHMLGDKAAGATGHASGEKPADPLPVAPHQRRARPVR